MDFNAILADDDLFFKCICLLIVCGFVVIAVIRSIRGDQDLDI